jgi:hypothetical protein
MGHIKRGTKAAGTFGTFWRVECIHYFNAEKPHTQLHRSETPVLEVRGREQEKKI